MAIAVTLIVSASITTCIKLLREHLLMNLKNNYFANDNYPVQVNAIPLCE